MKKNLVFTCIALLPFIISAQMPASWTTTGIGGGSAFFTPSVNPLDTSEYYLSCEGSELFHTNSFGDDYSIVDFRKLQGGHNSVVRFTNDPNVLYSISYANNLIVPVKTTDRGNTWSKLPGNFNDSTENYGIWADYNNPNRVIVYTQTVIWFSNDGGNSFSLIHFNDNPNIGVVIGGVFFDGNNIYIGTNDGLLESTNGGTSFSKFSTTGITKGEAIASFAGARQGNSLRFFCLTGDSTSIFPGMQGSDYNGFMKSIYVMDNNSGTWVKRVNGIDPFADYLMFVAMAENDTSTAYLGGSSSSMVPNLMKTSNGGLSWNYIFDTLSNANIFTGWCGDTGDYHWSFPECVLGLTVSPKNKDVVLFTDFMEVMKTNDGGATWKQGYVSSADQHTAGAQTPARQYYHSVGLENSSCWYMYWNDPNNVLAGCSDIFAIRSKNGGNTWSFDYDASADTAVKNTVYCITKNISNGTLYAATSSQPDIYKYYVLQDVQIDSQTGEIIYSTDSGSTWRILKNFHHPVYWLATDPNNSDRMYASVVDHLNNIGGVWMTNNLSAGTSATWMRLPVAPHTLGHPATITVLKNGKALCSYSAQAGTSGFLTNGSGVFLFNPVDTTWVDKSITAQRYWSRDVIVDQNDTTQNTWYSGVYNGYGGTGIGVGGLYRTTNGGNAWTRIFSGGDVSSCTINPKNKNEMFVTTNGKGLWYSFDVNGITPTFIQVDSYAFGSPERVFFNPFDQYKIWITSFGNGLQWADKPLQVVDIRKSNNQLIFYPNPATESVTLNIGNVEFREDELSKNIRIFDLTGREVSANIQADGRNILIGVNNLPAGLYLVQMTLGNHFLTGKLVKE